jgi:hypothetical protein
VAALRGETQGAYDAPALGALVAALMQFQEDALGVAAVSHEGANQGSLAAGKPLLSFGSRNNNNNAPRRTAPR